MKRYLYLIKKDKLYGYINSKGEIEITPMYKDAMEFSDGLAKVTTVEGESYFIDEDNNPFIKPDVDWYLKFENGYAEIKKDGKYGFIDKKGQLVIETRFDRVWRGFNKEGFAIVRQDNKDGIIDKNGDFLIKPTFLAINEFSEGVMSAKNQDGKYGFIDINGNTVIDFKFEYVGKFSEGLSSFKDGGKEGFINKLGEVVIKPRYSYVLDFHNGLAAYLSKDINKMGYINQQDEIVIKSKYDVLNNFNEGIAVFCNDDSYGYIDIYGNEILKNVFLSADDFKNGLGLVATKEPMEWGYVNKKGEWVYKPKNFSLW
ncbi:WG repeat-containing protein [Clostridium lundense]|uniref:WG repeat-containing protein n=1 Tax=Clostridium lundense TaxID=319475 RepID=UPI00047F1D6A|nr:WG repeat-containing protein [Clostridium lundense]